MTPIALLAILTLFAVAAIYAAARARRRQARLHAMHQENIRRQQFVLDRLDEISKLIEDKTRSNAELQAAFDPLLAELMAGDIDGTMAPLIADTEKFFNEHLAKRKPEPGA